MIAAKGRKAFPRGKVARRQPGRMRDGVQLVILLSFDGKKSPNQYFRRLHEIAVLHLN